MIFNYFDHYNSIIIDHDNYFIQDLVSLFLEKEAYNFFSI